MLKKFLATAAAVAALGGAANAATVTYNDILLGSGLSVTSDGVTMTATTDSGGALSNIGSGTFTGLYVGVNSALGVYALTFSEAITSILIEFDALSDTGGPQPETITAFATDNGSISIMYTNQFGTTFDGTTITSTENDGQGIIEFMGAAFTQFIFTHAQTPGQNGFVIERIVINTADGPVIPAPPAIALFLSGAAALGAYKRRRKLAQV